MVRQISDNRVFIIHKHKDADGNTVTSVSAKCEVNDPDSTEELEKVKRGLTVTDTFNGTQTVDAFITAMETKFDEEAGIV